MILEAFNQMVMVVLFEATVYFALANLRVLFFPQKKGVVLSVDGTPSVGKCMSCAAGSSSGKASLPLTVRLDDGSLMKAEASPCSMCIDKIVPGCTVGITKVGSRTIAFRAGGYNA